MTKKTQNEAAEKAAELLESQAILKQANVVVHDDFTATGTLPLGIFHNGKLHKSFKMRLIMVADTMKNKQEDAYLRMLQTYTSPVESIGEIPSEELTLEFYQQNFPSRDLDTLVETQSAIRKKRESTSGI